MPRRGNMPATGDPVIDTGAILTPKQRALISGVVAGKTQMQAAIDAGYSPETARSDASRMISQPALQAHLREMLISVGLDTRKQAEILADAAMNAHTMIVDKNGDEHLNRDHRTSIEAVRIAMAGSGLIGPRQTESAGGITVNITVDNRMMPSQDVITINPDDE